MSSYEIVSINTGKPQPLQYQKKEISSGIFKRPVDKALFLSRLNFDGDGQADLKHHGGKDKAVCVYPYEHYSFWEKELNTNFELGAFGENLTSRGLLETEVCIGDIFELGEAVVQVSQPRQPCYKLAARYGYPEMPLRVEETGYTGFYFRVLKEGMVSPGGSLKLVSRHSKAVTLAFANQMMHREKENGDGMRRILDVEELSESWRSTFLKRLGGQEADVTERRTGQ